MTASRLISFLLLALPLQAQEGSWLGWFSRELREVNHAVLKTRAELARLGVPVMSQTTAELGYQHQQLKEPPPTAPWLQLDLGGPRRMDWIVLVPALVDWQAGETKPYGFPQRFRVDVSNEDDFSEFTAVAVFDDSGHTSPGLAPAVLQAGGLTARYVRVTVTELAEENDTHFFALSELMVVQGAFNIALNSKVSASNSANLPPRWHLMNLMDGRSPLGPPIEKDLLPYDGLFADQTSPEEPGWIKVDLGRVMPLQELRLHPVHARLGADVPGFAFPLRFRVELCDEPEFQQPVMLLDASDADYPNPGNNPVVIPAEGHRARFVRLLMVQAASGRSDSFGLSEIEVFSNDENAARAATVTATPDRRDRPEQRPASLIVDGYTSYGKLLPLSEWLARWETRSQAQRQLRDLESRQASLQSLARQRAWLTAGSTIALLLMTGLGFVIVERRKRANALEQLRNRLAQDLHDEIGSNIAGIAMISETAAHQPAAAGQQEDWLEVNKIAQETTAAMREVLWLVGARAEAGPDFMALLQRTATRLLPGMDITWRAVPENIPSFWAAEARRQVFLFFKEALTNITRHARARQVTLSLTITTDGMALLVQDDGVGFNVAERASGMGLTSMKERARSLRGQMVLQSESGKGTRIELLAPLRSAGLASS